MKNLDKSLKIAAVVVTYNRLYMLKECIESLRNQTHPVEEIIIINNSSTDGTLEWLEKQNDLTVISQNNSGSAGGQYSGIKTAFEKGYEWIWCLDDDGLPSNDCLEKLRYLCSTKEFRVLSPIVVSKENHSKLAFETPYRLEKSFGETWNLDELRAHLDENGILAGWSSFFNGVLINREVVSRVGLPKRELFIWGDEIDYANRIEEAGFQLNATFAAVYFHPTSKWVPIKSILNRNVYGEKWDWRAYCYFRNQAYLSKKKYRFYNIKFVIAQIYFYLFRAHPDYKTVILFLTAYVDGLLEKFDKRLPF